MLEVAEQNLIKPMSLKVAMDNFRVCAFYEKDGWQRVSMHDELDEPYILYVKQ